MKYLIINTVADYGSTGGIVMRTAERLVSEGHEVCVACGRGIPAARGGIRFMRIGGTLSAYSHVLKARLFDRCGFGSRIATKRFLKAMEAYAPNVVWLHNLHGYYIHVEELFEWLKAHSQIQVRWTLHDCWAFTGHCAHFTYVGCDKWKTECCRCPQVNRYPKSLSDHSKQNYRDKKKAFLGVKNMTLHPVSYWLDDLVKHSFLGSYPGKVMYNEVDREIFRRRESDFRTRYALTDKKVILSVAGKWNDRKGLYEFFELAKRLPHDYRIVLVGLNPQQMTILPPTITGISEVHSPETLAEIYSAADLYVSLSKEETFGMTVLEAHNCGTPVLVYRGTACEEIAAQYGGMITEQSLDAVEEAVYQFFRSENSHA